MSDDRILVGPWRGEVGTEVTYWQPWVQRIAAGVEGFWSRAVVVSRGGMGQLYHPGVQTVDLYALRGVAAVAAENLHAKAQLGINKPIVMTAWEQAIHEEIGCSNLLHPSQMVQRCLRYWQGEEGLRDVARQMDVTPLVKPPKPEWLPERYTAVKWYHREGVHEARADCAWQRLLAGLAARGPVVWVGAGNGFDRHVEGDCAGVCRMPDGPVEDNLARQAAVIAHAEKFVGSYGGLAQLALRLGVPTVALYPDIELRHRAFNQWIAKQTGVPFLSGSVADVDVMRTLFV